MKRRAVHHVVQPLIAQQAGPEEEVDLAGIDAFYGEGREASRDDGRGDLERHDSKVVNLDAWRLRRSV